MYVAHNTITTKYLVCMFLYKLHETSVLSSMHFYPYYCDVCTLKVMGYLIAICNTQSGILLYYLYLCHLTEFSVLFTYLLMLVDYRTYIILVISFYLELIVLIIYSSNNDSISSFDCIPHVYLDMTQQKYYRPIYICIFL